MDVDLSDPVELLKIFDQADQGVNEDSIDEDAAKADAIVKDGAPDKEAVVDRQQKEGQEQAEGQPEKEPDGVATKDGKHVIPYSVLKSERDRAAKAEQLAKEASARIADLTAQLETAKQGAKPGENARTDLQQGDTESLSDEEIEFLKDDNPAVYKALKAIEAKAAQLQERLKPVEAKAKEIETDKATREAELVQSAIDSIPKLAHIQSANAEAYALAQQFDTTLQGLKEWAGKPLSERFAKAVQMVEDAIGPIEIPQASNPSLKPEDLKAAAKAKAAEASKASRTSVPTSLSEFPAGQAPATDERELVESLSPTQLAAKMARMTPEQLDAYLANL